MCSIIMYGPDTVNLYHRLRLVFLSLSLSLSLSLCWWVLTSVAQQVREEVVEDFVRNFLITVGLHKTADIFQAEW